MRRLRQRRPPKEVANLIDPHAGNWEPVRNVRDGVTVRAANAVHTSWGEDVLYWAAAVRQDDRIVGVVAVGEQVDPILLQAHYPSTTLTAYDAAGKTIGSSIPGLSTVVGSELAMSSADAQAVIGQHMTVLREITLGTYRGIEFLSPLEIDGQPVGVLGSLQAVPSTEPQVSVLTGLIRLAAQSPRDCADVVLQFWHDRSANAARAFYRCHVQPARGPGRVPLSEDEFVARVVQSASEAPPSVIELASRVDSLPRAAGGSRVKFVVQDSTGELVRADAISLDRYGHVV